MMFDCEKLRRPGLFALVGLLGFVLLVTCGCGSSNKPTTYPAGGKVTFPDGRPLAGGLVEFRSIDGTKNITARAEIQSDGSFELGTFKPGDGAVAGKHQVLVGPPLGEPQGEMVFAAATVIDPRFERYKTSGLTFTVETDAAKNHFNIQVTPPRRR